MNNYPFVIVKGHWHDTDFREDRYPSPSGTSYEFHSAFFNSTGTVSLYPTQGYYQGNPIITWVDFFSGRYRSTVFVKCAYCGNTNKQYEYNLLGHPVCSCCGAEIG